MKLHNTNVISFSGPWADIATQCDALGPELAAELLRRVQLREPFVCAALPRARYAGGGFALLSALRAQHTLSDPLDNPDALDAPATAWMLPYEWLAQRARRHAGLAAGSQPVAAAHGLHFAQVEHIAASAGATTTPRAPGAPDLSGSAPPQYRSALQRIRQAIARGDVYQVNLTRSRSYRTDRAQVLQLWLHALAQFRPAFAQLWYDGHTLIACLSPEELWSCDGSSLVTAPIKGTALHKRQELLTEKNRAEHTMIVDLERNDLHRICLPGTVQVPRLAEPTAYGGVEHLVSLVQGRLRPGITLAQLIDALAPGGSVTGAPKLAAIDYIRKLERQPRGIYCGALALTLETSPYRGLAALPIRTAQWHRGWMRYGSGGGITIDSDADTEYRELLRKQYWLQGAVHG